MDESGSSASGSESGDAHVEGENGVEEMDDGLIAQFMVRRILEYVVYLVFLR